MNGMSAFIKVTTEIPHPLLQVETQQKDNYLKLGEGPYQKQLAGVLISDFQPPEV